MVSLDSLLGRAELKERIRELEEENENLERRLEKTDDRRREAERGKQEAYEERNRLESKVEELRDRLERAQEDDESHVEADVSELAPDDVDDVVDLLASVEGSKEQLTTAYVAADDSLPDGLPDRVHQNLSDVGSPSGRALYIDDHGVVDVCLLPLRPVEQSRVEHGERFEVDRALYRLPDRYVAAVVHVDSFAAGAFDDGDRTEYVQHSSNVKSGHSKGGFSQKRFERLRDEQIQEHLEDSAGELRTLVDTVDVDAVYLLGARDLTEDLEERAEVDAELRRTTDARGEGEQLLEDAVRDLMSTQVYRF